MPAFVQFSNIDYSKTPSQSQLILSLEDTKSVEPLKASLTPTWLEAENLVLVTKQTTEVVLGLKPFRTIKKNLKLRNKDLIKIKGSGI
jgi:hypothetical protein